MLARPPASLAKAIGAIGAIGLQCAGWPAGGIREQKAGEYLSDPESPADRKFALYNAVDMTI